jgi:hypothetical protein
MHACKVPPHGQVGKSETRSVWSELPQVSWSPYKTSVSLCNTRQSNTTTKGPKKGKRGGFHSPSHADRVDPDKIDGQDRGNRHVKHDTVERVVFVVPCLVRCLLVHHLAHLQDAHAMEYARSTCENTRSSIAGCGGKPDRCLPRRGESACSAMRKRTGGMGWVSRCVGIV